MSDNEIERIRRDHIADPDGDPNDPHCAMCSDASYPIWPCDTAVLLAVVDSQRTIMDAQTRVSERHRKRVQELARQVAALREALALARGLLDTATPLPEPGSFAAGVIQQLDAALATAGGEGQRAGDNDRG